MRNRECERGDWKEKYLLLVMLISRVPRDMSTIEVKKKCNEVGLYCFAIRKVGRSGERFRVTLTPKANKGCQRIGTEKMSAQIKRLVWRQCIAHGLTETRRKSRANGEQWWCTASRQIQSRKQKRKASWR